MNFIDNQNAELAGNNLEKKEKTTVKSPGREGGKKKRMAHPKVCAYNKYV